MIEVRRDFVVAAFYYSFASIMRLPTGRDRACG
jgi:hypothetical protein